MNKLHFKTAFYRFYSPYVFKLRRAYSSFLARNWQLNPAQKAELVNYVWDRFLSRMFYREVPYYAGKPFSFDQVKRSSDTIFVLGCGASIDDITDEQWQTIGQYDSIGVNYFYVHDFKPTYHMIELGQSPKSVACLNDHLLSQTSRRDESVFVHIRHLLNRKAVDLKDENGNLSLYSPSVPKTTNEVLIKNVIKRWYPKPDELIHHASNLDCAIHFAYQAGYKNIYLLGVDLNSNQYFWDVAKSDAQALQDVKAATMDDYRISNFNANPASTHATADKSVMAAVRSFTITEYLSMVNDSIFKPNGINFATCSPKSLLRNHFDYKDLKTFEFKPKS